MARRLAQAAFDKAGEVPSLTKQVSNLENEVSILTAKILHHEECNSFLLGIVESACEMLRCEYFIDSFFSYLCIASFVISFIVAGTCLDFAAEERRVDERNAALERVSADCETLWSDPRRRSAVVLLQDRAQHIGDSVDGCR
jgi:hypothetical protein